MAVKVIKKDLIRECAECGFQLFAPDGIKGSEFPCRCNEERRGFRWYEPADGVLRCYTKRGRVLVVEDLSGPNCGTRHTWEGFLWACYGRETWDAWVRGEGELKPAGGGFQGFDSRRDRAKAAAEDRAGWWFKDSVE